MMNRFIAILLLSFSMSFTVSTQCPPKAIKLIDKARVIQYTKVDGAIEYLNKAIKLCPGSEKANFLLADLYNEKRNYLLVKQVLDQYLKNEKNPNRKVNFFLADAECKLFLFEDAVKNYQLFLDSKSSNYKLNFRAKTNMAHALFAQQSYASDPKTQFTQISSLINSEASEYLPIMTADETKMVFTRREEVAEEAYFSDRLASEEWSQPQTLAGLPDQYRKAAVSISIDGAFIVFAMADHPRGFGNFDLYFMEYNGRSWSHPTNLGREVNSPGWESQPCISADNRTVYFSTDRKGGEGANDIWKTKRQPDGRWSEPTNLGIEVNGPGNEESPFIHRDQRTLYFRSDAHPGLGSFDIFMSRLIRFKKWTIPLNLGYPINTVGNDGSLFVNLNGLEAYIASNVDHLKLENYKNQSIHKDTDIYRFQLAEKFRPIPTTYSELHFIEENSNRIVRPHVELVDFHSGDTLFFGMPHENGRLLICLPLNSDYVLTAISAEHIPYFERFEPTSNTWDTQPVIKEFVLRTIPKNQEITKTEPVILRNVLFETNSSTLQPGSYIELEKLFFFLEGNSQIDITIQGHTDAVGDDEDNLQLSIRRSKVVYDYLLDRGIAPDRLDYKGFGEKQPIADNNTESGRKVNRRTEFVIR